MFTHSARALTRFAARRATFGAAAARHMSSGVDGCQTIGVIGMGLMGHGIAQVAAQSGFDVVAVEMDQDAMDSGMARIEGSVAKLAEKGRMTQEDADAAIARITQASSIDALSDCDLVVEAIVENLDIKKKLFADLDAIVKPDGVLASNTSSFPIHEMADATGRPDKVVGVHFFNPVQLMKLVEVARTDATSDASFDRAVAFGEAVGKVVVGCKDTPGFVVNRLLVPFMAQALAMLDRGDATPEDIDNAMRFGAGHPMGPVHLADYVGLGTNLAILEGWQELFPDEPAFIVPDCLRAKVAEGKLGRKTGEGFYKWDGDKKL